MNNVIPFDTLMSREQAAKYLGYSAGTLAVWKSLKRYNLPCVIIGRNIRYRRSDLDKFIEESLQR